MDKHLSDLWRQMDCNSKRKLGWKAERAVLNIRNISIIDCKQLFPQLISLLHVTLRVNAWQFTSRERKPLSDNRGVF